MWNLRIYFNFSHFSPGYLLHLRATFYNYPKLKFKLLCFSLHPTVYLIPCQGQTSRGQCKESYIGESERSVKTRFLEHKRRSSTKSEVSQHIYIESPGHTVDLDKVKILDKDDRWFERGVKEAIYIRAYKPSLNKDGGRYRLPRVYDPLLTSLPPTSVNQSRQIQPASADER